MEYVDVKVDQGTTSYDPATRTISWTLGDVVVGDPYAWVRVRALNVGSFIFRPTLTTDTTVPNIESNIQVLNVNVQQPENLKLFMLRLLECKTQECRLQE